MKHKIILIFITLLCASCAGYRVTKFTAASVKLGDRKELLLVSLLKSAYKKIVISFTIKR